MQQRILVVEGAPEVREQMGLRLERAGYRTVTADNTADAVDVTLSGWPETILMDVDSPQLQGLDLIRRLRSRPETSRVPILAMSDRCTKALCEEGVKAGAQGIIEKGALLPGTGACPTGVLFPDSELLPMVAPVFRDLSDTARTAKAGKARV